MDENLLQHIFQNILSNAIKYSSEDSQIEFNVTCGNGFVICEIIDQGIGMSEQSQKHLFEKFYLGDKVGNIKGTGLGLSILQECVDMHYGCITVNSVLGLLLLPCQPNHLMTISLQIIAISIIHYYHKIVKSESLTDQFVAAKIVAFV